MRIGVVTPLAPGPGDLEMLSRHGFRSLELLAFPGHPYDPRAVDDRRLDELRAAGFTEEAVGASVLGTLNSDTD